MRHSESASTNAMRALGAAVLALSFSAAASAATTVVYRCLDAHLGVVYTDTPCNQGSSFDVQTGEPDLVAVAKLERIRDALDQSATQRIIDERRLAGQKELLAAQAGREAADMGEGNFAAGAYAYYAYPLAIFAPLRPHPPRHRPMRPLAPRGGAPHPPYIVPRT